MTTPYNTNLSAGGLKTRRASWGPGPGTIGASDKASRSFGRSDRQLSRGDERRPEGAADHG
jgi:hypothetical protein